MSKKPSIALVIVVMATVLGVQADTFNGLGGTTDWTTDANWLSGTAPAAGASVSDHVTVIADAVFTTADVSFTVTGDKNFKIDDGATLSLQGGTINHNPSAGWDTFEIRGSGAGSIVEVAGGTLNITEGKLEIGSNTWESGALNLISGSINVTGIGTFKIGSSSGSGDINISGGTASFSMKPTIGANGAIDFDANNLGTMTITGADEAYYQGLYAAGTLTHGGVGGGVFTENFNVTGSTITAIPEPATLGMVAAFGGAMLFIRRKLMI